MAAPRLAASGDLAAVPAEGELLDQVGHGFTHRSESDLHLAVGCDVGDPSRKTQGLNQAIVQIDLGDTLLTGLR